MSYRRTARRTRWMAGLIVVGLTVAGAASGWAVEQARGPQFQASTDVLVQFWGIQGFMLTGQGGNVSAQDVADAATLATSPDVLDLAATRLGKGTSGDALAGSVTALPQALSNGFTIVATGTTAAEAQNTSEAVATAMTDTLQQQISDTVQSLEGTASGDFQNILAQRAQVLTTSVKPLQVLRTAAAQQTGPSLKTPMMLGVVGLAAGVLLVIALLFSRPVIRRARDAQRLTELPAVSFARPHGGPEATQLVRRLLDGRPNGRILMVPVDATAQKSAEQFAEWARHRTNGEHEAARIAATVDPVGVVLDRRPVPGAVAAVVLIAPEGVARSVVADAVALLGTWQPADAVVVSA